MFMDKDYQKRKAYLLKIKRIRTMWHRWTRSSIIRTLRLTYEEGYTELPMACLSLPQAARRLFGSMDAAYRAAGVPPPRTRHGNLLKTLPPHSLPAREEGKQQPLLKRADRCRRKTGEDRQKEMDT